MRDVRVDMLKYRWTQGEDPDSTFMICTFRSRMMNKASVNTYRPGYFFMRGRIDCNERFTVPDRTQQDWNRDHIYRVHWRFIGTVRA